MSYDIEDFQVPSLGGVSLRLFAELLENPVARAAMLPPLLRSFGVATFRARELSEPPSPVPLFPDAGVRDSGESGTQALAAFLHSAWWQEADAGMEGVRPPGVLEFAAAYRDGSATPEQVAQAVVEAVTDSNQGRSALRAVTVCDADDLMAQARASTKRFLAGEPLGILDGVPVGVKDELDMAPYPTSVGTSFLGESPVAEDAASVSRLRSAGALLIGKTNMHEIGIGVTGVNAHHGTARNPYDVGRITGGSSSGSAAAVAAGLCVLALGADGGGSIRIPAALCGVVGLKPTFGRVSEIGAFPLCWSMGHIGPIAWRARDVALAYAAMAGVDERDHWTLRQPPVRLPGGDGDDLAGIRLGIFRPWFDHGRPAQVQVCRRLVETLEERGARVVEVDIPDLDATRLAHVITIFVEMATSLRHACETRRRAFGLDTRVNLAIAQAFSGADYVHAQRMRTRAVNHLAGVFERVDAIVTPAAPVPAPLIPESDLPQGRSDLATTTALMRYMFPANLTGFPAITFPAGYDEAGLPVGIHLMGRPWEEDVLLKIALVADRLVERRLPGHHYRLLEPLSP